MASIQIDMFEVQLGASILMQFKAENEAVCVLADAGVKASGYAPEHVRDKVKALLGADARIDLVIGTHYDEDHLNGLVPIIEDASIKIGEAWLPPVLNDTLDFAVDQPVERSQFLPHQFSEDGSNQVLDNYLKAKHSDIQEILKFEFYLNQSETDSAKKIGSKILVAEDDLRNLQFFRAQLEEHKASDDCIDHGTDQENEADPLVVQMVEDVRRGMEFRWRYLYESTPGRLELMPRYKSRSPNLIQASARSLAHLRRSTAKAAINAKALHDVMEALRKRGIATRCEVIEDGTPRRYCWNEATRRFKLSRPGSDGLSFTLLGPSRSLVRKHRAKLPVLAAISIALNFLGEIKSITPSNQLSYIGSFRYQGQGILIAGDAGCVDFSINREKYHPKLLTEMRQLHVIQVAHHGGNNAHFYRVLDAAGFPEQESPSYLLLSHATNDKSRPSDVFRDFILTALKGDDKVRLLFTSMPKPDKVKDYLGVIHPSVGLVGEKGDIKLRYEDEWQVTAHAIKVP